MVIWPRGKQAIHISCGHTTMGQLHVASSVIHINWSYGHGAGKLLVQLTLVAVIRPQGMLASSAIHISCGHTATGHASF